MADIDDPTKGIVHLHEPIDLHPEIRPLFSNMSNLDPPMEQRQPAEVRGIMDGFALRDMPPRPNDIAVEDHVGKFKGRDIRLRLYRPKGIPSPAPVMLYFHGGGYVLGNLDTHDRYVCMLAKSAGVAYLAVEYRLAPENPFPAPEEDAFDAILWVHERAPSLGLDPERIGLSGDSAGAQLSAASTIRARDRGGPKIRFQLLIYPGGMSNDYTTPSYHRWDGMLLTTPYAQWFGKLRAAPAESTVAFPLYHEDLRGLPPAYVVTCEYDICRDQGEAYAMRLMDASVPTTLRRVPKVTHPFFRAMHISPYVRREMREMGHQIRRYLVDADYD
jgi:acetyl esterase